MKPVGKRLAGALSLGTFSLLLYLSMSAAILSPSVTQSGVASAQQGGQTEQRKTKRTPTLREKIYNRLGDAQEKVDAGQHKEALEILNELKAREDLSDYERAMTWQFTAYSYTVQEKYKQAIPVFDNILALKDIPLALELNALYSVAQLHMSEENYKEAVEYLDRWFRLTDKPTPSAHVLKGQAQYQMGDYKGAIASVEKAVALARQRNAKPNEQWLLILRAAYYETNNMDKVISTLETLVNLYPKGQYFAQLSAMYGERGREDRQLLVLEAGYDGGYLETQSQYVSTASLLLNNDVPYKAAQVLLEGIEKGIVEEKVSNLRLLAQAWIFAQEPRNAIGVLRKAAKKSDDGELYVRLGRSYADLDEWNNCINAVRSGIKKGGIDQEDSAYITLGMCLFNADKLDGAISAFSQARKISDKDSPSRRMARRWIDFLKGEKARRLRIENSLTS